MMGLFLTIMQLFTSQDVNHLEGEKIQQIFIFGLTIPFRNKVSVTYRREQGNEEILQNIDFINNNLGENDD